MSAGHRVVPSIRALVAHPRPIVREGLVRLLEDLDGVTVPGWAADRSALLAACSRECPDVVLVDSALPDAGGVRAVRDLKAAGLPTRSVILYATPEISDVEYALANGACGFLLRDAGAPELEMAVRAANAGAVFLCPSIMSRVLNSFLDNIDAADVVDEPLKHRARDFLELVAGGAAVTTIATRFALPLETVERLRTDSVGRLSARYGQRLLNEARRLGVLR